MRLLSLTAALLALAVPSAPAGSVFVPQSVSYQGRVAVGGINFDGTGLFKFALVNPSGTITHWSNDGTSVGGAAPVSAVSLPVSKGLYAVLLGDGSIPNMTGLPASAFSNSDVRLRVWFNDGIHGFQQLTPDQPVSGTAYARLAETVGQGGVSTDSIRYGAVTNYKLAPGAIAPPQAVLANTVGTNPNQSYTATFDSAQTYLLPEWGESGDLITIYGAGTGGWTVEALARPFLGDRATPDGGGALLSGPQGTAATFIRQTNGSWTPLAQRVIASGAVGSAQIASGAVGTTQIASGAVTGGKIASGAVGSTQLASGAVGSAQLGTDLNFPGTPRTNGTFVVDAAGANTGTLTPGVLFGGPASGEGVASRRTAGTGQFNLALFAGGNQRLTIANGGNVGIGTTNPTLAKLVVSGSVSTQLAYAYLNASGAIGTVSPAQTVQLSIHASDRIACTEFEAYSDARIKDIAGLSDAAADLRTLQRLEITDYTFKDRLAKGDGAQKKVIAQQVEVVFPQAVKRLTDVIPDIYRAAEMRAGWIQLATSLQVGERVRLVAAEEAEVHEVLEVRPGAFRTGSPQTEGKVFVYGREVKDFRSVDYDALSMLNVSATQELARRLEAKEAEVAQLRDRLARLERLLTPSVASRKDGLRPIRAPK